MADFRVCIQNLNAYNNGRLVFEWTDVDFNTIEETVKRVLAHGGEEYEIADTEGFPVPVPSSTQFEDLISWKEELETTHLSEEIVAAYCNHHGFDVTDDSRACIGAAEDAYIGTFATAEAFAVEYWGDGRDIPEDVRPYIDWDMVARDLLLDGYFEENGHYFISR